MAGRLIAAPRAAVRCAATRRLSQISVSGTSVPSSRLNASTSIATWRTFSSSACLHKSIFSKMINQPTPHRDPHLLAEGELTPGISAAEYRKRRQQLAKALPPHSLAIITAFPTKIMSCDIPYPFHQNTDFLYLCGLQEPDAVMLIETGSEEEKKRGGHKMTLVLHRSDPSYELWNGPRCGLDGALKFFNADEAYSLEEMPTVVSEAASRAKSVFYDNRQPAHPENHATIAVCISRALSLNAETVHLQLSAMVQELRLLKTPAERDILRKAGVIGGEGFAEVMRRTRPGVSEGFLMAVLEGAVKERGAQFLSFPPVVAGGDMALILHYVRNSALLRNGEMVLVDGGAEYNGYVSDISRTFPINGKFSKAQRELYEAVLRVQKQSLQLCAQKDATLELIHQMSVILMGEELARLGIVKAKGEVDRLRETCLYYPHHVSHYMGMDTHDTGYIPRTRRLTSGMVVTIEPGVYIPRKAGIPEQYQGIGIRIEDDVLITETGPEILTGSAPKEIDEIEAVMASFMK